MIHYSKDIDRIINTDVLVIGGGSAGFAAALASARNGAKTLLIDQNSMLGGMATAGLVGPFMTCYDNDAKEQIVKGIFDEVCRRMEEKGGAIHPSKVEGMTSYSSYYVRSHRHVTPFSSEVLEMTMEDMIQEAGVDLLYNVKVCDAEYHDGKIDSIIVCMKEGLCAIKAKDYIDCTGDVDVAYFAGLPLIIGNGTTGEMQPTSLFFEVDGMDRDKFVGELQSRIKELGIPGRNCWSWYIEEAKKNGDWTIDRNEIGNYEGPIKGRWKINTTRMAHVDGTNTREATKAIIEGRKQVQEILRFMRKYLPGCKNVQLVEIATVLGVRETRRINGEYLLTADDIMKQKHFDDAICTFAYAIDIHNSEGGGATFHEVNHYYTIPFRCLVPQKCDNLLVAGRCISGTSDAAASFRVIPCCMATGEAAGTATALALKTNCSPKDVNVDSLRKKLIEQGAVIKD
ncbi:MAG: FAD-dependent oxidoreductase [Solobacterium sp.]|jgi:hypothetical protein|nr:FAD-dependent oxidoreductase [Solobacterium sp.]